MPGFSPKAIVIDSRGHVFGRLSSIVAAKLILTGGRRNQYVKTTSTVKLKYLDILKKRCNAILPKRGPLHFGASSDSQRLVFRCSESILVKLKFPRYDPS